MADTGLRIKDAYDIRYADSCLCQVTSFVLILRAEWEWRTIMEHMYITKDPRLAEICDRIGIERVWIDLEWKGKELRQKNMDSVKSKHKIEDILQVKKVLKNAKLQVRINPMDDDSEMEIRRAIDAGADMLMVPMLKSESQAEAFSEIVEGRVPTILLLETKEAQREAEALVKGGYFDEVHVGLNDLSLAYGYSFMFQVLADGTVDRLVDVFSKYQIPYGFGGVAKIGQGALPAEMVLGEHGRLGSERVILSRSFFSMEKEMDYDMAERILQEEFEKIRSAELEIGAWNGEKYEENRKKVEEVTMDIVKAQS